jgi:hypothetical protein
LLLLLSQRRPLTELRLRETGRELKCIHPLRNDFGSIAVIAPVLRQSSKAVIALPLPSASAQARALPTHPRGLRREHPRARRRLPALERVAFSIELYELLASAMQDEILQLMLKLASRLEVTQWRRVHLARQ